jgi:hypothetical protein
MGLRRAVRLVHQLALGHRQKLIVFLAHLGFGYPVAQIAEDLAHDVLMARFLEIGEHDGFGIGLRVIARQLEDVGHPKAHQLVAPRLGLEGHLLVVGKLVLEGVFAIVEGGHSGSPVWNARRSAGSLFPCAGGPQGAIVSLPCDTARFGL